MVSVLGKRAAVSCPAGGGPTSAGGGGTFPTLILGLVTWDHRIGGLGPRCSVFTWHRAKPRKLACQRPELWLPRHWWSSEPVEARGPGGEPGRASWSREASGGGCRPRCGVAGTGLG